MTTHTAWIVLEFCLVVCALALALRQVRRFNPTARRTATRIAVTFGVFALAAGYVWLEIGPHVDQRLTVQTDRPLISPPPQQQDV